MKPEDVAVPEAEGINPPLPDILSLLKQERDTGENTFVNVASKEKYKRKKFVPTLSTIQEEE